MGLAKKLHIHELGPICKSRKKIDAVLSESEDCGENDFRKQFSEEKWPDDDKSMWLSFGSSSPSSCFEEYRLSSFLDPSLEEFLTPLKSKSELSGFFLSKAITLFDGSRVSPIEEALLVLDKTPSEEETVLQEELKEEEVVTWLIPSSGNNFSDSSVTISESAESLCSEPFEDLSTCDDSSSRFSTDLDSPFWARDIDKTVYSVSLINLDGEESDWISDKQSEMDLIQSDFPSPSYKSSWGSESSGSYVSSKTEICDAKSEYVATSEAFDLADFSPDKPLFWPTDANSDCGSDFTWDFFIMSPRKNNHKLLSSEGSSYGSFRLRVQSRKMDMEKGCRRRLVFGSGSKSSNILELKCTNGNKEVRRSNTMPSRLSESTKSLMKIAPLNMEVDKVEANGNGLTKKSMGWFSEEGFDSNMELPIEKLLGLDEFDGREGVESEFNKDDFSLNESL